MKSDAEKLYSMLHRLMQRVENAHPAVVNQLPPDIAIWWRINKNRID